MSERYRLRASEVEAIRYDGTNADEIIEWSEGEVEPGDEPEELWNLTSYTVDVGRPGDWLVKDSGGEFVFWSDTSFTGDFERIGGGA